MADRPVVEALPAARLAAAGAAELAATGAPGSPAAARREEPEAALSKRSVGEPQVESVVVFVVKDEAAVHAAPKAKAAFWTRLICAAEAAFAIQD